MKGKKYKNKMVTISELSDITNKPYHLIYQRLVKLGWSVEKAISEK